jgi:hypothetical protein
MVEIWGKSGIRRVLCNIWLNIQQRVSHALNIPSSVEQASYKGKNNVESIWKQFSKFSKQRNLYTYSFCTRWFLKSAVTCWCHSLGPLVPSGILSTAKYTGTIFNHVSPVRFNIWTFDFMVNVRPVNLHQQKKTREVQHIFHTLTPFVIGMF